MRTEKLKKSLLLLVFAIIAVIVTATNFKINPSRAEPIDLSNVVVVGPETEKIQSYTYRGRYSSWVSKLLTRTGGWKCPANASDKGKPPSVEVEACMRDKYVAAAVLYAWAAECYARSEEDSKAEDAAVQMYKQLQAAQDFCSDAPSVGGGGDCDTADVYRCGEL